MNHTEKQRLLNRLSVAEEACRKANCVIREATMDKLRCEQEMTKIHALLAQDD